jgi:hypothetical protein
MEGVAALGYGAYEDALDARLLVLKKNLSNNKPYLERDIFSSPQWSKAVPKLRITEKMEVFISLLSQGQRKMEITPKLTSEYWKESFCSTIEFQSNLFPLGAPSTDSFPREYRDAFGLKSGKSAYREESLKYRFGVLRGMIERFLANPSNNKRIISFGTYTENLLTSLLPPPVKLCSTKAETGKVVPPLRFSVWETTAAGVYWFYHPAFRRKGVNEDTKRDYYARGLATPI